MRPPGDGGKAYMAMRNAFDGDEAAGNEFEVGRRAFKDFRSVILDLALHLSRGTYDRGSGHIRHAACRCAPIVWRAVGVGTGDAHAVKRYAQRLCADLAKSYWSPTDIDRPGIEQDRSVLEQADDGAGRQQSTDMGAARYTERAAALRVVRAAARTVPSGGLAHLVETFGQSVRGDGLAAKPAVALRLRFFRRNSMGSRLSASAISSSWVSIAKVICGTPKPRKAPKRILLV